MEPSVTLDPIFAVEATTLIFIGAFVAVLFAGVRLFLLRIIQKMI